MGYNWNKNTEIFTLYFLDEKKKIFASFREIQCEISQKLRLKSNLEKSMLDFFVKENEYFVKRTH